MSNGRAIYGMDLTTVSPIRLGSDFMQGTNLPTVTTPTLPSIPSIGDIIGSVLNWPAGLGTGSQSQVYVPSSGVPTYTALGKVIKTGHRHHMNVCNPRALRRAMRRVQGFAKVAHRTISFVHRVKMKKRGRKCR